MIYLDAAYVAKCYLNEPGANRVRRLARGADGLTSSEWGRLEFVCIVQRHLREGHLSAREAREVFSEFEEDEAAGVWHWILVTSTLLRRACDRVRALRRQTFLRAGDAVHLVTASEHGYREIYTNDRHMLVSARHFDLVGIDVIALP